MSRAVGVVVPAYRPNVERLRAYVRALDDVLSPRTIRVELDAPDRSTVDALSDLPADVAVAERRRGKGTAVTAGFEALAAAGDVDVFAFADADGATPAESIADVVTPVVEGTADLAAGSRRHPDADVRSHQTFARRFLGDGFAWLARQLLDVSLFDYQCGAKALTRETWSDVRAHLYEPGFAWDIELVSVADALGARVVEVPVIWEDQPKSTVAPVSDTLRMFRGLLVSRHRAKTLRENRLHTALDQRNESPALVDRIAALDAADE